MFVQVDQGCCTLNMSQQATSDSGHPRRNQEQGTGTKSTQLGHIPLCIDFEPIVGPKKTWCCLRPSKLANLIVKPSVRHLTKRLVFAPM